MRLCRFTIGDGPRVGRIEDSHVVQVSAPDLVSYLHSTAPDIARYPLRDVRYLAPVINPPSIRDFYSFVEHAQRAFALRGAPVPAELYAAPRFYFSNPAAIVGPDDIVCFPAESAERDYELELAGVVGHDGQICGFTIMNDWSARDIQRAEVKVGLGPVKAKDFATSLGPVLVTPDEFGSIGLEMSAAVNGEVRSRGNSGSMYHSWASIVKAAGGNTTLRPGDVLASGTVGSGCILELGDGRWLQPGDVVELEIEGIGVLRNTVGSQPDSLTSS